MKDIMFTTHKDLGYEPRKVLTSGEKRKTLRRHKLSIGQVVRITLDGKPTPAYIRVKTCTLVKQCMFMTKCFALADGMRGDDVVGSLKQLLERFYGAVPIAMWNITFELVRKQPVAQEVAQ